MLDIDKLNNFFIIHSDIFLSEEEFKKFNKIKKIERLVLEEDINNSMLVNVLLSYGMNDFLKRFEDYEQE